MMMPVESLVSTGGTEAPVGSAARGVSDEAPTTAGVVVGVAAVVVDCLPIVSPHLPACAAHGCPASWRRRALATRATIVAVGAQAADVGLISGAAVVADTVRIVVARVQTLSQRAVQLEKKQTKVSMVLHTEHTALQ